ncbi:nuclear transport factor 2 family protein [Mucilaginibacter sp. E4BP6]|uniref:nuclear transport factor 2 family protein n=1 Tax=Mucilaginibacter sp. E4BP6 TaxID=2723089 RepID=UPI0017F1378F|nr:nuclear transport factor 2 family protein [Mucilaginibacter sp. E4BP6]NYE67016.1 hypothetical protein [Mucilaginibacter sp. E4BP6]
MEDNVEKKPSSKKCLALILISVMTVGLFNTTKAQRTMKTNKELIIEGFDKWTKGTGNVFDLIDDDIQWTIAGSSPQAKTYIGKKQFMDELIIPLNERLSQKIVPTIRNIYADGNMVLVLWDGQATAKDGKPYNASYCWNLQMHNGKIVKGFAFLDNIAFADILSRLPGNTHN